MSQLHFNAGLFSAKVLSLRRTLTSSSVKKTTMLSSTPLKDLSITSGPELTTSPRSTSCTEGLTLLSLRLAQYSIARMWTSVKRLCFGLTGYTHPHR